MHAYVPPNLQTCTNGPDKWQLVFTGTRTYEMTGCIKSAAVCTVYSRTMQKVFFQNLCALSNLIRACKLLLYSVHTLGLCKDSECTKVQLRAAMWGSGPTEESLDSRLYLYSDFLFIFPFFSCEILGTSSSSFRLLNFLQMKQSEKDMSTLGHTPWQEVVSKRKNVGNRCLRRNLNPLMWFFTECSFHFYFWSSFQLYSRL